MILPVCTNTPIALSTPFVAPIASISCFVIVLYSTSEAPFCETLKSAFPSCSTDTAVSRSEVVSTPSASTAVTPIATATAVTTATQAPAPHVVHEQPDERHDGIRRTSSVMANILIGPGARRRADRL